VWQSCILGNPLSFCLCPQRKSTVLAFILSYQGFCLTCEVQVAVVWVQRHSTHWPLPWRLSTSCVGEEIWSVCRRKTLCRNGWKKLAFLHLVFSCCGIREMENICNAQCWPYLAPALNGCRCCHSGLNGVCVCVVNPKLWGQNGHF